MAEINDSRILLVDDEAGIRTVLGIVLADSGYEVTLVEKKPSIGGIMAQLDKTFPTMDCSI